MTYKVELSKAEIEALIDSAIVTWTEGLGLPDLDTAVNSLEEVLRGQL